MVSPILAQAILEQRAPDLVGQFQQGQEQARQKQVRTLAGEALKAGGGESLKELEGLDPQIALALGESIRARSGVDIAEFVRDAKIGERMLQQGNSQGFLDFADQRIAKLRFQGRDTADTETVRDLVASGQSGAALQNLQAFTGTLDRVNTLTAGQREFTSLTEGLSLSQKNEAALIKLGLSPRAVGSAVQTISNLGIEKEIGDVRATIAERSKFGELTGSSRAKSIDKGFTKIASIDQGVRTIDRAIEAIQGGAGTGAVQKFLPSIKAASVSLDNIQKELALDVIGGVTLGAISAAELDLAKQVALPTGLDGPELIQHLQNRKAAQLKLRDYFQDQIDFLDQGGTVAGFLRSRERQQTPQEAPETGQPLFSSVLNKNVTETDIQDTLSANPGTTRAQLLKQLGVQ